MKEGVRGWFEIPSFVKEGVRGWLGRHPSKEPSLLFLPDPLPTGLRDQPLKMLISGVSSHGIILHLDMRRMNRWQLHDL
jgi:hypothetical protein